MNQMNWSNNFTILQFCIYHKHFLDEARRKLYRGSHGSWREYTQVAYIRKFTNLIYNNFKTTDIINELSDTIHCLKYS